MKEMSTDVGSDKTAGTEDERFSVDDFTKNGFKILMEATKCSNQLPKNNNWNFYKAYDSFNRNMKLEGDKILQIMNRLMHHEGTSGNMAYRNETEQVNLLVDTNDTVLERVATNIDIINGVRTKPDEPVLQTVSAHLPVNGSWNKLNEATYSVNNTVKVRENVGVSTKSIRLLTAKNIIRPQQFFKDRIDNSTKYLWKPRIADKPNSLKPLAIFLEESDRGEEFTHPYHFELDFFVPRAEFMATEVLKLPKLVEETPLKEVSTPEQLDSMLEELRKYKEIGIDLEHHSYRTFLGITCLMQISTCDCDYIVDTLALRDKLWILNEVFTKQSILKIFHGADCDIEWLQRDLSLYIVNMFDTHQAAKLLQYNSLSLAYLLTKFCRVASNKHFQLADWRIRPLPDELKLYARQDTHYLIYIYQCMKKELNAKSNENDNLVKAVFEQSTRICKKRYKKPVINEDSHMDLYRRSKKMFDNKQLYALKYLYEWRDSIAREEDESTGYILPNHMMLQISETLPREMQGVLACCNPIPPIIRANLLRIHEIILKAREQPAVAPILKEQNRSRGSTQQFTKINIESPLYCPHDIVKNYEFRDDLPTLLSAPSSCKKTNAAISLEKNTPMVTVFNVEQKPAEPVDIKLKSLKFLGPYERYKLVKPFIEAEEANKAAADAQKIKADKVEGSPFQNVPERMCISPPVEHPKKRKRDDKDVSQDLRKKSRVEPTSELPSNSRETEEQPVAPVKRGNGEKRKRRNGPRARKVAELTKMNTRNKVEFERKLESSHSFDYSKVNFEKYKGGAASVTTGTDVKSKFKSKNRNNKARGGGHNKSFTYTNASKRGGSNHNRR